MKTQQYTGFADIATSTRKIKEVFFHQMDTLIDWRKVSNIINKHYQKGENVCGRPSYPGLMLFKICLLQTWYGLSDYEVEDQVNDRISFSRFAGISLDDHCPDHSVISRFRSELTQKGVFEKLFKALNKQLESNHIIIKTGIIVDASITDSPRKPKGAKEYELVEDRKEDQTIEVKAIEIPKKGVDKDGRWVIKAKKLRFGYKQHTGVDPNGLIVSIVTTSANESDIKHLEDVVKKADLNPRVWVKADKGYKSKENDEALSKLKLRNHIMHKAYKSRTLTPREQQRNSAISKIRYKVERTFGSMRRWFSAGVARYVSMEKMHSQHLMEAMAYNLYRSPGIIMSNQLITTNYN